MKRRSHCSQCGRCDNDCGRISKRGLCVDCGIENMRQFSTQMATKQGPAYNQWLRRQSAGVQAYQAKLDAMQAQQARHAQ